MPDLLTLVEVDPLSFLMRMVGARMTEGEGERAWRGLVYGRDCHPVGFGRFDKKKQQNNK